MAQQMFEATTNIGFNRSNSKFKYNCKALISVDVDKNGTPTSKDFRDLVRDGAVRKVEKEKATTTQTPDTTKTK